MASKSKCREIAKDILTEALSVAYYKLADNQEDYQKEHNLSDEELEAVYALITKYGTTMCKAIGREYYTL